MAIEFDGRVDYTDPWRGRSPGQVLWEEERREDELRALGIRVVRVVHADLGPRWRSVETRLRDPLDQPGPPTRSSTATPRIQGLRRGT